MNRGSEWRKWDLHVHTPETAKNNQFGNADEAWPLFIEKLEASDSCTKKGESVLVTRNDVDTLLAKIDTIIQFVIEQIKQLPPIDN